MAVSATNTAGNFAWGGPVAAGIGAGAEIYGGIQAGRAAKDAANNANEMAWNWIHEAQRKERDATQAYDQYSPYQQAQIDKAIQSQTFNLQRQQRLVESIDPSLIEAGKQMKQLLDGQSAPVLQNMKDQRMQQRQTLLDSLRQQVGPGAETSSVGLNALNKFDSETSNLLSGAQQQYLNQVSGMALGGATSLGASLGAEAGRMADFGNQYGQIGLNKAGIIQGMAGASNGGFQSAVNSAGGNALQSQIMGQTIGNIGSGLVKWGFSQMGAQSGNEKPQAPVGSLGADLGGSGQAPVGTYSGNYSPDPYQQPKRTM